MPRCFFRKGISWLQETLYGVDDVRLMHSFAESLPWYLILLIPVAGGLVVGLILHWFTPDGRVRSVADVIEGAALADGRVEQRAGLASALASLINARLGGDRRAGRGRSSIFAAVISSWVSDRIKADGITGARSAWDVPSRPPFRPASTHRSPARFSRSEVVLRHFAVHAFAPIDHRKRRRHGHQPARSSGA